jgi:hypothetical protein
MKNDIHKRIDSNDEKSVTFKITKRRMPWSQEVKNIIYLIIGR